MRKKSPTPDCSGIVVLNFSTLYLNISQFYFLMGKRYDLVVEYHLDVVKVISPSLIIRKRNGYEFFYFDLLPPRN